MRRLWRKTNLHLRLTATMSWIISVSFAQKNINSRVAVGKDNFVTVNNFSPDGFMQFLLW